MIEHPKPRRTLTQALVTDRERALLASRRGPHPGTRREGGYVAVATAILMVLLVLIAALGIDTAIFFTRAAQLQRAADAAALAGVTKMPKFQDAKTLATKTALDNRMRADQVTVNQLADSPRSVRVSIHDTIPSFFGKFIRPSSTIERHATAEYVPNVQLGSKLNSVGTGNRAEYGAPQGFWLAINGYCAPKEAGDRFSSAFEGNLVPTGSLFSRCWPGAGAATKNTDYDGDPTAATDVAAYGYTITIPCPDASDPCTAITPVPYELEIFNPLFDNNGGIDLNYIDPDASSSEAAKYDSVTVWTHAWMLDTEGVMVGGSDRYYGSCGGPAPAATCQDSGNDSWWNLFTLPAGSKPGTYTLQMSSPNWSASYGSNAFGLGVHAQGSPRQCTGDACPTVAGETSMGVYANISGVSDFFLAKLSPARYYRGKKIRVSLWDPGEGASGIQILAPTFGTAPNDFVPTDFTFGEADPGLESVTGFTPWKVSTPTQLLDVSGTYASLPSHPPAWNPAERRGQGRYNGRLVQLDLQIPTTYGCASTTPPCVEAPPPQDGWYKIRYITASGVTDRTTWSVNIVGDPVHLVHD